MVLGPLFRQVAQNERSLFAFLGSSEPFGFREFLRGASVGATYRPDDLYDYVTAALGPTLFAGHRGKVWAEVQTALERLHDASGAELRLAKTIGLFQALGPAAGVPAAATVLAFALGGETAAVEAGLAGLTRRSVVVFRRHAASYALWEGSDLDLDERLRVARGAVEREPAPAGFLAREMPPAALVARRHYFQTGTLRHFAAAYVGRADLQGDLFQSVGEAGEADGRVLYCLPRDPADRAAIAALLRSATADTPVVAALPLDSGDLPELCHDLMCLRWAAGHSPELESDRTARRELDARLAAAEQALRSHLAWLFSTANPACAWFCRGDEVSLATPRQLNDLLSRACDEVFPSTPVWRNELVNRRSLSSSAAAARRNLIEAMFDRPDREGLGFEGHPPERSMYETLLKEPRLHRKQAGEWGFHPPDAKSAAAVREIWKAVEDFLAATDTGRRSVSHLFAALRRPPFGLKDGVLPVLLAAALVHAHAQVALYEEGTFVPKPNAATFERLFRAPHKFELQRFRLAGPRAEAFRRYAGMIQRSAGGEGDLLTVVRPMVRLVKGLPEYVGKTKRIGEAARQVLKAVREARQPDVLLFADLPAACGHPPFAATGAADPARVDGYFGDLRSAFEELQRAYPGLLAEVEGLILKAFGEAGPLTKARREIEHHARRVLTLAVEAKLKAFLLRVTDDSVGDDTWLESIATLLAGKPPVHWDDHDGAKFELQLAASARAFNHYKILAFSLEKTGYPVLEGDKSMLLVSITGPERGGVEKVVQVPPELAAQASRVHEEVRRVLQDQHLFERKDVSVAILAELMRQMMAEAEKTDA